MAAIYLIRHGQASWGSQDYDVLSEIGREQAKVLGRFLSRKSGAPPQVISGAMRRHLETAEHTLRAMGDHRSQWSIDARWNEYDHRQLLLRANPKYQDLDELFGQLALSSDPRREFQVIFDRALLRWVSGDFDSEYNESWPQFQARIRAALEQAVSNEGTTLVFTSGGAIAAAISQLWTLPDVSWLHVNRVIANAGLTKLIRGRSGLHLSTFNEHSHFEGDNHGLLTYR
jgi:broad specificity phosphatase PhoE